jgi:hypothetical protein
MAYQPGPTDHAEFPVALQELAAERGGEGIHYAPTSAAGEPALAATAPLPLASHISGCVEIALVRQGPVIVATPGRINRLVSCLGSSDPIEEATEAGHGDGSGALLVVEEAVAFGEGDERVRGVDDGEVE